MTTGTKLFAGRFEQDDTSAALLEQFQSVADVGIDWLIEDFGVTRIEASVNANSPYDAYDRYDTQLGQRFALYGGDLYRPVSGWIFEVEWLPGDRIRYVAYGVNFRLEDGLIVKKFDTTDTITTAINTIMERVAVWNGDTDTIETNATTLDGWNPQYPQGSYPREAIPQLLDMSDSSSNIYDFRMIDEPMSATQLNQFEAHYTARDSTTAADWIVNRSDLSNLTLSRNIIDFYTVVRVWYGLVEGTSTAVTANTMTDGAATFYDDGVAPGDQITNLTKGGRTRVLSVDSQTQITHEGWRPKVRGTCTGGSTTTLVDTEADFIVDGVQFGDTVTNIVDNQPTPTDGIGLVSVVAATTLTISAGMSGGKSNTPGERYEISGVMGSGDDYSISTKAQVKYAEHQIDEGVLWQRELAIFERNMNATQAAQLAKALATVQPQQVQSFIVSSPFIKDNNGAKVSLFKVIAEGGGYIQISDLYPAAATFSDSLNSLTTFFITGMSLDNKTNKLTVDVDNPSRRLDARLLRAKILRVPQVRRY